MVCDRQSTSWEETAALHVESATNISFVRCAIEGTGASALWIDRNTSQITVDRVNVSETGSGGIRVGGTGGITSAAMAVDVTVCNCNISQGGNVFPSGTPILVQKASNVLVSHNEASYFCYAGISVGWSWKYASAL